MDSFINLVAFRKKNRLTQQQVADFIGTSMAFVSLVEKGSSKLPDDKLNKLYLESTWDTSDLVPHFERLLKVWREYNKRNGKPSDFSPLEDEDPFNLGSQTVYYLFYGKSGIDNEMANDITRVMPDISRDWLLNGTGEMFAAPSSVINEERIALLEERVRALEETVNRLKDVFKM